MFFNSLEFAIFLPVVFLLYWFGFNKSLKVQNLFLLVVSYVFYGWWDWRFLSLIIFSSFVDYNIGLAIFAQKDGTIRKRLLWLSLFVNLGFLGVFKYYNFFVESFIDAFSFVGLTFHANTLDVILPVGISFYTFQTLSYTIDIYKRKLKPTTDVISFFAFVSFFPQLVAGPIERAKSLLPQFYVKRVFDYGEAKDGLRYILWGLFKKVVIADTVAILVNDIFENYETLPASVLVLGAIYFAFQIYADFSGYSDIAIGTAKLFGFKLMRNFAYPYFSRDMAEFWRRWHISLSTWFRDYVYIPLGGSRGSSAIKVRNVFIIFLVSGFWHGANWTFIIWGALNALYFIPLLLLNRNRKNIDSINEQQWFPSIKEFFQIMTTFLLACLAWIFFRAESLSHAVDYLQNLVSISLLEIPSIRFLKYLPLVLLLVVWEWVQRFKMHGLEIERVPTFLRWGTYMLLISLILFFFGEEQQFIYFQF